jgi:hypothetical protein
LEALFGGGACSPVVICEDTELMGGSRSSVNGSSVSERRDGEERRGEVCCWYRL